MSYTEKLWDTYLQTVLAMYGQGYMVGEIARALESSEELVQSVVEKHYSTTTQDTNH